MRGEYIEAKKFYDNLCDNLQKLGKYFDTKTDENTHSIVIDKTFKNTQLIAKALNITFYQSHNMSGMLLTLCAKVDDEILDIVKKEYPEINK